MSFFLLVAREYEVADLSPKSIFGQQSATKPQMVPTHLDLNIGFQGWALIQGQIYNPKKRG